MVTNSRNLLEPVRVSTGADGLPVRMPEGIPHDLAELDDMMAAMARSPSIYRPGQYWDYYTGTVYKALKAGGLGSFRRDARFDGFVDVQLSAEYLTAYRVAKRLLQGPLRGLKRLPRVGRQFTVIDVIEDRIAAAHRNQVALAYNYLRELAADDTLSDIEDSTLGEPLHYSAPDGRRYTLDFLNKYDKVLSLRRHVPLDSIATIVELGGGFGCQAEVLLKLKPELTYVIVDIAPQLFISQSYLSAVFGADKVLGYSESHRMEDITPEVLRESGKHVVMLAPFDLPKLSVPCDLFWSDYAMMEMDFEIVRNYASFFDRLVEGHLFIADRLRMDGGRTKKTLKAPMSLDDVLRCFPQFSERHREPYRHLGRMHASNTDVQVILSRRRGRG